MGFFFGKRELKFLLSLSFLGFSCLAGQNKEVDVVIYGDTSAAIASAVQVKRMGKTVVVVSPGKHLGGLSSSGLGWTDSGKKEAIGGIARVLSPGVASLSRTRGLDLAKNG